MSSYNKAKGTRWETDLEDYLNGAGLKARRLPRAGAKDIGDLAVTLRSGRVIILEAKNVKVGNLKEFLRQAEVEATNYCDKYETDTYPVVAQKARQQGTGDGRITMTVDTLVELLQWEGLA